MISSLKYYIISLNLKIDFTFIDYSIKKLFGFMIGNIVMIKDLTKGKPLKLILLFALPILLGNIFQQLFHISDILIVGRLLGVKSLAALGASAPIFFMFLIVAFGFTGGLTVITAQRFGAKDIKGVKSSFFHSLVASFVFSVIISFCVIFFLKDILTIMNVPQELMDDAYKFTFVLGLAMSIIILYNLLSGVIRALGDSKTPLYFLIGSSLLNIVFNFIFIKFFVWGVQGSAMGTLCSVSFSALACIVYIYAKYPILKLKLKDCQYSAKVMKVHLRVAIPMALQFSILSIGLLVVQSLCNSFGTEVIAGFTAAMRIEQVSTQPLLALGVAFATYSAQNFGAILIKRIRQGVRQCLIVGLILSIMISLIVRFYGIDMISFFIENEDRNIIQIGQNYLLLSSYFYFFLLCIFIVKNAIQGMGKTFVPVLSSVVELVARIVVALYLSEKIGYMGVFWSGPIAWFLGALTVVIGYFVIISRLNPIFLRRSYLLKWPMSNKKNRG